MELRPNAASLLTNEFFKSRPNDYDLVETLLTEESLEEIDEMSLSEFQKVIDWLEEFVKSVKGASRYEIIGLLGFIEKYGEAIEYDCITLGLRLRNVGTDDFTWGDLLAIVQQSPRSSALGRALHPDESVWGMQEQLLALIADYISVGNWQRSQGKKKDYPKPIPRPGVEQDKKFGADALPMDEMASWLGWEK